MVVTYYGFSCFKLQSGDTVVAVDPFGKGKDLPAPRFEAQVVVFSDPNAKKDISIAGSPLLFSTPGEYESRDISFLGVGTPEGTAFYIEWEGMKLLHLGSIASKAAAEPVINTFTAVDILFVSTEVDAEKIIPQIDPRIIVPFQAEGAKKNSLDAFIKEVGEKAEKLDKLTVKAKGLPTEGQRLVVLDASR